MPKTNDMREKLKALKLFGEFTDTERDEFLELAECAQFKAGEHIVRQDERGDCMYVILEGTAKVIHHKQERRTELATLGAGRFLLANWPLWMKARVQRTWWPWATARCCAFRSLWCARWRAFIPALLSNC